MGFVPKGVKFDGAGARRNHARTRRAEIEHRRSQPPMTRPRPSVLLALLAVLGLAIAACSSPAAPSTATSTEPSTTSAPSDEPSPTLAASAEASPTSGESAEARVRIKSSAYDPPELTIAAGTEVTFVNADGFAHTVTEGTDGVAVADPIVDEEVEQSGTVKVTFDEPGTYHITCKIHSSMNITITVEG
jgi:plastocyanin